MSLSTRLSSVLIACGLLFTAVDDVSAQQVITPRQISFQGIISEGDKVPADGQQTMTFTLYTSQFSTQAIWTEEQGVTVRGGLFNVYLGEKNPLPENFSREYWIGVSIKGSGEFTRVKMTSVPYAFQAEKAQSADVLSGGTVTKLNGLQGNIDFTGGDGLEVRTGGDGSLVVGFSDEAKSEGILNQGTEWLLAGNTNATTNSWLGTANNNPLVVKTNNAERMRILATGNVGIGETNPAMKLTVARQLMLTNTGGAPELRMAASSGINFTSFKTTSQSASITYTLPSVGGTAGSALVTDANDVLSWTDLHEWKTIGNNDLSATSFIGSTNAQPFILKTNNVERLRVTATGAIGINETAPVEKLEVGGNIVVAPTSVSTGELRFAEAFGGSGNNYTAFKAQAQGTNITYQLPSAQGGVGQVLTNNGSGELYWAPAGLNASSGWSLDGNAVVSGDFIGTTNAVPLDIRVNNTTRLYLPSSGAIQRNSTGNGRGTEAIDLQTTRSAPGQVASGNYSVIGGGRNNQANGQSAMIAGGESNIASGTGAVVSGGTGNTASNTSSTIGGGSGNTASGVRSGVFSGNGNTANAQTALVVGGSSNNASATSAVVSAGDNNTASGAQSFVGSGTDNTASGTKAVVVGGNSNTAQAQTSVVVGGFNNVASGVSSAIVGGENNVASQARSFIGTGTSNTASGQNSTVLAGSSNSASGNSSMVGTGVNNSASADNSFVGSGRDNMVNNAGLNSGIVSGFSNLITSNHVIIGGGFDNTAGAERSFIGGGQFNIIDQAGLGGRVSFIGGGHRNQMYGDTSFIGGGSRNNVNATSFYGFVGGGVLNSILTNDSSTIGGGASNTISVESDASFIGGGIDNTITQNSRVGSIVGGRSNTITTNSIYGSIGGGHLNNLTDTDSSTIGGGATNLITTNADASTISGGNNNTVNSDSRSSTIGGGHTNTIGTGTFSATIGGGNTNDIGNDADYTTIGGGLDNNIADGAHYGSIVGGTANNINGGTHNFIGGGQTNTITTGNYNVILGGQNNTVVSGNHSGILGGTNNTATGDFAFALGTGNAAAANGFALGSGSSADSNEFYAKYSAGLVMEGEGTGNGKFIATFINPGNTGDENGIAIQINKTTPGIVNDFVQFRDATGTVVGRIEGQTIPELDALGTDSEHTDYLEMLDYLIDGAEGARDDAAWGLTQSILDGAISVADMIQQGVEAAGEASCAAGTLGACSGGAAAATAGVIVKIAQVAMIAADIIGSSVQLGLAIQGVKDANQVKCNYINYMHANIGVTYESGSADYAEWLPKVDTKEKFIASDIVALKGGKISKNTMNADQLMVISTKPIVLGNTPEAGKTKDYEKVAFMGQVPVRVLGKVNLGDYILPSGGNNGLGIAVAPSAMKTSDYKKIVGTAWSAGDRADVNVINVAVGLNTNSLSAVIEKQAAEIRDLQLAASYTQEQLKNNNEQMSAINSTLVRLIPGYREEMKKANVNVKSVAPVSKMETPSYSHIESPTNLNISDLTKNTPENKKIMAAHVEDMKNKQDFVLGAYTRYTDENSVANYDVPKTFFNDATMEEAFRQAESELVKSGMDLKTNPFFSKIKNNPAFKEIAVKRIQGELNKAAYDRLLSSTTK